MSAPFSYELITTGKDGPFYRVRDAQDNKLATCYSELNAHHITEALNYQAGLPVIWSCGRTASAICNECHQQLATKAYELREKYDLALEQLTEAKVGGI